MGKRRKTRWVGCPIRFALGVFGDKWSLLIVRDLMFKGKRTYGEFLNAGEGIATNILADRLARLEENGIVTKTVDRTNRARFNYRLSEKGLDLMPMMFAMIDWSEKYDAETEVPPTFIEKVRKCPHKLRRELRRSLEKMD